MPIDDTKATRARELAITAARATLLDTTVLTGPRQPDRPVTPRQLTLGGEFVSFDARVDAQARIASFLEHTDLPLRLVDVLRRAHGEPTIARLHRAETALRALSNSKSLSLATATSGLQLADELLFHQAALGSAKANACCAALALQIFYACLRSGSAAKIWLALRAATLFAADATEELDEASYVPGPLAPRLAAYDEIVRYMEPSFAIAGAADRAIRDEEDIMRGGAGAWAPDPPEVSADLAGIMWPDQGRPPLPAAPTMVVLAKGSLDHLPGSEASGSSRTSRSSTPRGEYGPLAGVALPLVHGVDVVAVGRMLNARFPWFSDLTALLLRDLAGGRVARLRNTLAVSPPGSGKTSYLRAFCQAAGIPCVLYNAAGVADAAFGGTSRQWSTGRACFPLQTIQRFGVANPAIIVDEIDKAGTRAENGRLVDSLVAMLEPAGATAYLDPYLEVDVDLSAIPYLATANGTSGVPSALLDRLRIVHVGLPRAEHLAVAAANLTSEIRDERGLDASWLPDLDGDELHLLGRVWKGGSLRPLRRAVTTLLDGRETLARRH